MQIFFINLLLENDILEYEIIYFLLIKFSINSPPYPYISYKFEGGTKTKCGRKKKLGAIAIAV